MKYGVSIDYKGRSGNIIIEYMCARLFAIQNKLELLTDLPEEVKWINPTQPNHQFISGEASESIILTDKDCPLDKPYEPGHYIFNDFLQKGQWYEPRINLIKTFFEIPVLLPNKDDIVMHIRTGDYHRAGWVIHPAWYLYILEREKFNKLYIVTENSDDPYLIFFRKYNPIIISRTIQEDFYFMMNFDKIICSNSSLCWCAAMLSTAARKYIFKPWIRDYGLSDLRHAIIVDGRCLPPGGVMGVC